MENTGHEPLQAPMPPAGLLRIITVGCRNHRSSPADSMQSSRPVRSSLSVRGAMKTAAGDVPLRGTKGL
jgi:hypothetical protein